MLTKNPEVYYKEELLKCDSIEEEVSWLNKKMATNKKILDKVKEILESYDEMDPEDTRVVELKQKSTREAIISILMHPDIQKHVGPNEDILERYQEALVTSGVKSKSIILKRHPNERYQNNYNLEWLFAWDGNMDLQISLDFFEIVTYITQYYSKDDSGVVEYLKKAKRGC